jgi:hypothetical protein
MMGGRLFRYAGLLALAILVAAAQGCGGGSSTPPPPTGAATSESDLSAAVSEADIEQYKAGTPQHTALAWWRAVQLNEPELARTLYVEPPTLPNLAGQFNFVTGQLGGTVKIASVKQKGKQTIVTLNWHKPGTAPRQVTLQMESKDGEAKIASTLFLDLIVQKLQRAEAGASAPSG